MMHKLDKKTADAILFWSALPAFWPHWWMNQLLQMSKSGKRA